jgi:putative SbcD/Mre11-related phosphoesterase
MNKRVKNRYQAINGIVLTPQGMAVILDSKTGVIADLHIGMEELSFLTSRIQTAEMLKKVIYCIEKFELENLVIAGDIKQGFGKTVVQEWDEINQFFEVIRDKVNVIIIKGNHDFYIRNMLKDIKDHDFYRVGKYIITHGHKEVLRDNEIFIIGNEHPAITIKDEIGVKVKLRAYLWLENKNVLVLPAFNPLSKGSDVLSSKDFLSPLLKDLKLEKTHIYAIDDESEEVLYFGTLKNIKDVFNY